MEHLPYYSATCLDDIIDAFVEKAEKHKWLAHSAPDKTLKGILAVEAATWEKAVEMLKHTRMGDDVPKQRYFGNTYYPNYNEGHYHNPEHFESPERYAGRGRSGGRDGSSSRDGGQGRDSRDGREGREGPSPRDGSTGREGPPTRDGAPGREGGPSRVGPPPMRRG